MALPVIPASLKPPALPRILRRLPDAKTHALMVLNGLLEKRAKLSGPVLQAHLAALVESDVDDDGDLQGWLRERCTGSPAFQEKVFSAARKQADRWMQEGRWAGLRLGDLPPGEAPVECPRVLFAKGVLDSARPWAAAFNSRKPKLVSPRAEWLKLLRHLLPLVASQGLGWAGSLETLTYDLVTVGAERLGARLLLFVPQPLEATDRVTARSSIISESFPELTLSCLSRAAACPKATRMVCRDRLLAFISDLHWVLELRPGGNLSHILEGQQRKEPRLQVLCGPEEGDPGRDDHRVSGPGPSPRHHCFPADCPGRFGEAPRPSRTPRRPPALPAADAIPWGEYLYHYTRACPGPWPGQSYRAYLESLLDAEALAEHTALAALERILTEGRIRASSKIVRGNQGVVSWTARPPHELAAIRHWNPALIRWTFEPYGLAVKRSVLKKLGAVPAIYGASAVFEKLSRTDRFRFQLHAPPRCSWKQEREWRLPDDLRLRDLGSGEAFLFAPTPADSEELAEFSATGLPIIILENA